MLLFLIIKSGFSGCKMNKRKYKTIICEVKERIARIVLNRPEVHNAFNVAMIKELIEVFNLIKDGESVRIVILTGKGKSFCAGADLNWMREVINYSFKQNLEESLQIAELHKNIYTLPLPVIAMVNGTAIGGGTGFLSACDIAIASEEAKFGLSEVKLGLVPAAISPYVVRKIGESKARYYFLTGERISAEKAREIGLINEVVPRDELEEKVDEISRLLLSSGPQAVANCKELIFNVARMRIEEAAEYTARMIADLRVSKEGQEGMAAFLEKRKPKWMEKLKDV